MSSWLASISVDHSASPPHDFHADGRTDGAADQLLHAGDEPVDVDRLGIERLPARERQQPVREGGSPPGGPLRHGDVAVELPGAALVDADLHHLQAGADAGEHVVEVMRDAAGELAHGLHLL